MQNPSGFSGENGSNLSLSNRADHVPAGKISQLLVGAMDIMPTVLGLMNLPIPETVQGVDLSK